jgi:hypothetical protein
MLVVTTILVLLKYDVKNWTFPCSFGSTQFRNLTFPELCVVVSICICVFGCFEYITAALGLLHFLLCVIEKLKKKLKKIK